MRNNILYYIIFFNFKFTFVETLDSSKRLMSAVCCYSKERMSRDFLFKTSFWQTEFFEKNVK